MPFTDEEKRGHLRIQAMIDERNQLAIDIKNLADIAQAKASLSRQFQRESSRAWDRANEKQAQMDRIEVEALSENIDLGPKPPNTTVIFRPDLNEDEDIQSSVHDEGFEEDQVWGEQDDSEPMMFEKH